MLNKFTKLFIKDIGKLYDASGSSTSLLIFMVGKMKRDNQVITDPKFLNEAALELETSIKTIRNLITELIKRELIERVAANIYMVNPFILAYGDEKSVENKRSLFLHIKYGINGRTITTGLE